MANLCIEKIQKQHKDIIDKSIRDIQRTLEDTKPNGEIIVDSIATIGASAEKSQDICKILDLELEEQRRCSSGIFITSTTARNRLIDLLSNALKR